jgi:hypothetical protein
VWRFFLAFLQAFALGEHGGFGSCREHDAERSGVGCLFSVLLGFVVALAGGVHRGHLALEQTDQLKQHVRNPVTERGLYSDPRGMAICNPG